MTAEALLLKGLADRAVALSAGLDEALDLAGAMPLDPVRFAALATTLARIEGSILP